MKKSLRYVRNLISVKNNFPDIDREVIFLSDEGGLVNVGKFRGTHWVKYPDEHTVIDVSHWAYIEIGRAHV